MADFDYHLALQTLLVTDGFAFFLADVCFKNMLAVLDGVENRLGRNPQAAIIHKKSES